MRRCIPFVIAGMLVVAGVGHAQGGRDPFRTGGVATPREPAPSGLVPAQPSRFVRLAEDLRETRAVVRQVAGLPLDARRALDVVTGGEALADPGQPFSTDGDRTRGLPAIRFVLAFVNIDGGVLLFEQGDLEPPLRVVAYSVTDGAPMITCVYAYRTVVGDIVEVPPTGTAPEFANWSERDPQPLIVSVTQALLAHAAPLECREAQPRIP